MNVIFYKISDDERAIKKSLSDGVTLDCNIRRDVDVYNPFFLIKSTTEFNPYDYNYIGWNGRYYFIRDINYTAKSMFRIDTHIDVLMSYQKEILASNGYVTQSTDVNPYFNGGDYPTLETFESDIYTSDITLSDVYNIVMITIGGV